MTDFITKIRQIRDDKGLSRRAFAELLGVPDGKIQKIEMGHQRADHEFLTTLTSVFDVDLNWLISGKTAAETPITDDKSPKDYIQIPKFTVSASAGNGAINHTEGSAGHYAFSRRWIERRGLRSDSLAVITVTGDSMEPKLRDNDLILVNRDETSVRDGKPYVVRIGDELLVKYVQRLGENQVTLLSANTFYPPRTIDLPEGDTGTIQIIGRVVASMHEW